LLITMAHDAYIKNALGWRKPYSHNLTHIRGGSRGVHREQVHPSQKNCVERSRYSNRVVTLIKQSHDHEAVHNRLITRL